MKSLMYKSPTSHHRFIEGSSNSTHEVATLSIPKLAATKTTIAI